MAQHCYHLTHIPFLAVHREDTFGLHRENVSRCSLRLNLIHKEISFDERSQITILFILLLGFHRCRRFTKQPDLYIILNKPDRFHGEMVNKQKAYLPATTSALNGNQFAPMSVRLKMFIYPEGGNECYRVQHVATVDIMHFQMSTRCSGEVFTANNILPTCPSRANDASSHSEQSPSESRTRIPIHHLSASTKSTMATHIAFKTEMKRSMRIAMFQNSNVPHPLPLRLLCVNTAQCHQHPMKIDD